MTGIIVCDNCNEIFFAHGDKEALPTYLKDIKIFTGLRMIKSSEIKLKSLKKTITPVFKDYCSNCAYDLQKKRSKQIEP